jgi:hypothetical protein
VQMDLDLDLDMKLSIFRICRNQTDGTIDYIKTLSHSLCQILLDISSLHLTTG